MKNARLVLWDGTTIYDPNFKDPSKELSIGDGAGSNVFLDLHFSIPSEKFKMLWLINGIQKKPKKEIIKLKH